MAFDFNDFDLQGHRGCRGLLPENTVPGFLKALELGVRTLELDTVISQDKLVVVSHEPYMSHEICLSPDGHEITEQDEKSHNIYQLTYQQIKTYDCGLKPHPRIPEQQKIAACKPLLSEVIKCTEQYTTRNNLPPAYYNIETKCSPAGDTIFHPEPLEFTELLLDVVLKAGVQNRTSIQSFDKRTLQILKSANAPVKLSLLVEDTKAIEAHISDLGFLPDFYSPNFTLVTDELVTFCQHNQLKLVPWTVNEITDMENLIRLGISGLITDYPDRFINHFFNDFNKNGKKTHLSS